MAHVRIYYECLEQGYYYLLPIVEKVFGTASKVELVEISRATTDSVVSSSLASALAIRNPDGIITVIKDGMEIPLVWLEFTTQVMTFDHTAQGFNSLAAAGSARIPVVKFIADRVSGSAHGGAQPFDPRIPWQILFTKYDTPGLQLTWPVSDNGRSALRDALHMACPEGELGLKEILEVVYSGILKGVMPADSLIAYAKSGSTEIANSLALNLVEPAVFVPAPRSTRFYKNESSEWTLKFNRWDHSMDPERGLAELMHHWVGEKLIGRIHDPDAVSRSGAIEKFSRGTGIQFAHLPREEVIDITESIESSALNRAGLAIAWTCKKFTVANGAGSDQVTFTWKVEKPTGLRVLFDEAQITEIHPKNEITEDDVAFVIANRFFPVNGFTVQSVSYPGAQGDFALITGSGRSVKRKYFDVIAQKMDNGKRIVVLCEAKGSATRQIISRDIQGVLDWRDDEKLRKVLLDKLEAPSGTQIIGSLAYEADAVISSKNSDKMDFVILVNQSSWRLWEPFEKSISGIVEREGNSDLPARFRY